VQPNSTFDGWDDTPGMKPNAISGYLACGINDHGSCLDIIYFEFDSLKVEIHLILDGRNGSIYTDW
jgi:hypothetical protein